MQTTEIDGVPVLFAPIPGPVRAGLMFRVGRVDETLATGGITHMVEHLALHRHGTPDYHYNGMTTATTTQFVIQGNTDSVVSFLNDVCAGLRDLPVDRLPIEKELLATEAANRSTPINVQMPLWRHGAKGYGLISYPEWGVQSLSKEQVTAWARTRFTQGNAVLWIAGEQLPAGLKLELPEGHRWPLPAESSALPVTPAYFTTEAPILVAEGQVPRTRAAAAFAKALDRALFRELRQFRGISYTAAATYTTDGRPYATVTSLADARPDQVGNALDCLLTKTRELSKSAIAEPEFESIRTIELERLTDPDVGARLLPRRATDLLTGFPSATTEELIEGFRTLTVDEVQTVARDFLKSSLLMLPGQVAHKASAAGFEAAPTMSRFAVTGTRHRSRDHHEVTLIAGDDGISLTSPQGALTVLFDDCAVLLRWPDGARQLIGTDGIALRIEPSIYPIATEVLNRIDAAVGMAATVDLPARPAEQIPSPARTGRIRRQIQGWLLARRAWLDRVGSTRSGVRPLLTSVAIATAGVTSLIFGIATDTPRALGLAIILIGILVGRRRRNGHW